MSLSSNEKKLNEILKQFQNNNQKKAYKNMKNYILENPNDLNAIYNFAYMSEKINKIDVAIENYKKVIKQNQSHWQSRFNLYIILINKEKYEDALKLINMVLVIKKNYQPALRDKALVMYRLGKPDEGFPLINQSIKLNPKDYIALNILGLIYEALKLHEKAKDVFEISIKINPKYYPSYNNLGSCYQNMKKPDLALENFKKSYALNKNFQEAINNIANVYLLKGKYFEAIDYYKMALTKGAKIAQIYYNIGAAYMYLQDYKKAEKYYTDSFKINPNDQTLIKNLSTMYLAKGEYKKAWERFDARLGLNDFVFKNSNIEKIRHKLWRGEEIFQNESILLIKEQGVGDEILYSSMYPDFIKKFPNSKIEVDSRLISIFARSFGAKKNLVPFQKYSSINEKINKFNKILYAGSLGRLFRNSLNEFPKKNYLVSDDKKLLIINNQLKNINNLPKIGITWKSKREVLGEEKSINLDLLFPILKLKNFSFINLQYGNTNFEIDNYYKKNKIIIHTINNIDLFDDFESIAALLLNLDLFITISNSTAHLAGALGVETWLIKPKNHAVFHYWNQPGKSTPWYPSIKLYEYEGSWEKTIHNIKKDLDKKLFNNTKFLA